MKILLRNKTIVLGLACFILGAVVSGVTVKYYLATTANKENIQLEEELSQVTPCGVNECLFKDDYGDLLGVTTIRSFYTQHQDENIQGGIDQCDGLTVVEASPSFIDKLKQDAQNANRAIVQEAPMINFPLHFYSEDVQREIKSSSDVAPLDVKLLLTQPPHRGGTSCNSQKEYEVLSVKTPTQDWLY